MNSLDFLHIALGGGFVFLVIFLCVMLLQLTLVLRDVSKIMENAREVSDRVKQAVFEPLKVLSEVTVGFSFVHDLIEKIKAKYAEASTDNSDEVEEEMPEEKKGFSVKKLRK